MIEYIQRVHSVNPQIDAYHNWPGFFGLGAMYNELSGLESAFAYAAWAQVFFNILIVGALWFVYSSIISNWRIIWFSVFLFEITNWINASSYLAPQAFGFYFYLIFIGICLRWFGQKGRLPIFLDKIKLIPNAILEKIRQFSDNARGERLEFEASRNQQLLLKLFLLLSFTVVVASHQLTPLIMLSGVVMLVLFQRLKIKSMPTLLFVIFSSWLIYMAITFFERKIPFIAEIFNLFKIIIDNMSIHYTSSYRTPAYISGLVLTLLVWILGLVGVFRRMRKGFVDITIILLALSPFVITFLFSYGGEGLRRSYLFSLPWVVYLISRLYYPKNKFEKSKIKSFMIVVTSLALVVLMVLAFYGNERMYYFTENEIAAMNFVYAEAPPGAKIILGASHTPRKYRGYEKYYFQILAPSAHIEGEITGLIQDDYETVKLLMQDERYPAIYLLISKSQHEFIKLFKPLPEDTLANLENYIHQSGEFDVAYENGDAVVFILRDR
jgi:hypothetical protein